MNLAPAEQAALLASEVVVEERIDWANVVLWLEYDGRVECALRSSPGSMDRAGQLGPLRAWVAGHDEQGTIRLVHRVFRLLHRVQALHAEWLFLVHTVVYDQLPSFLVVLDLWRGDDHVTTGDERDAVCDQRGW